MKGAFRHQNIIIFLNSLLSLAHKTNSARKAVINIPDTSTQNILTSDHDVEYDPKYVL